MNAKANLIGVATTLLAAAPLLALQGDAPAANAQPQPPGVAAPAAPARAAAAHVVGTLVALDPDHLEVMVEKAVGSGAETASVLVGQTHSFALGAGTERPATLSVGDHLDLWFAERDGKGYAVRVALVKEDEEDADAAAASPSTGVAATVAEPPAGAPAGTSGASAPATTATAAASPAAPKGAVTEAPKTRPAAVPTTPAVDHAKPLIPPAVASAAPAVSADAGAVLSAAAPPADEASQAPAGSVGIAEAVGAIGANASRQQAGVPRGDDPFPFIGIGVGAGALALALLYLTLRRRGGVIDLGLHAGGGGAQ